MADDSRFLGIDYGDKRVGIAVSDDTKTFAFTRDHLINDSSLFKKLLNIIKEEKISKIIIGHPISLNSQKTQQTLKVEEFKEKLELFVKSNSVFPELHLLDERLTSSIAKDHLISSGMKKMRRQEKGLLDSLSARIILQDYLDRQSIKNI
jgi:putative Holliday junction resolvase